MSERIRGAIHNGELYVHALDIAAAIDRRIDLMHDPADVAVLQDLADRVRKVSEL